MANFAARISRLAASPDGGTTWYTIGDVKDATFNSSTEMLDATTKDSGQFKQYLSGHQDATVDLSLLYNEDDNGQSVIYDAKDAGAHFLLRFRPEEASGSYQRIVNVFVTSLSESSPLSDIMSLDVSLQVSGDYSRSNQA